MTNFENHTWYSK